MNVNFSSQPAAGCGKQPKCNKQSSTSVDIHQMRQAMQRPEEKRTKKQKLSDRHIQQEQARPITADDIIQTFMILSIASQLSKNSPV